MEGKRCLGWLSPLRSPPPFQLLFLFTSSQGTRSLRTLIFPVSHYLPNWPLLFSRAFHSPPAPFPPPPPGVSMATAEGRKRLRASCNCAPAAALRERKREDGKQESAQQNPPRPPASPRFFQRGHQGERANGAPPPAGRVPGGDAQGEG